MNNKVFIRSLEAVCLVFLACGCQPYKPVPFVPKEGKAPDSIICHDAIGHNPKCKPWIMGGKCCCTPTKANFDLHVKNQTIDKSMTYKQYLLLYSEKAVVTDLDHRDCGNYCSKGPHVVMGGKCMSTPVPGTSMFETITYGPHKDLLADQKKNKDK